MGLKTVIRNLARRLGYEISNIGDTDQLASLIWKKYHADFFFIQIGANDGKRFDPIFEIVTELNLCGLAVEPVKEYFDELVENYKGTRVVPVNNAIYNKNQQVTIYRAIANDKLPEWTRGVASLNPKHYKKSGIDSINMIEEVAEGITFQTLIERYNVNNIDLLQIDTEGYDSEIIKMIPFEKNKPKIIHFEHGLNDKIMSIEDFLQINKILLQNNYKLIMKEYDCIAYL